MTSKEMGVRELREELPDVLRSVEAGQRVIVTRHGQRVATLVPTTENHPATRPRIVALASLKGGVGKTTLAMHLAAAIAQTGERVVVLDADEEISAVRWQQHAVAQNQLLPFTVIAADRNSLMRQARALAADATVIIDTPPNNREVLTRAASVADIVLVPVLPTGMDIDRLANTLELLADLEAGVPTLNYAIVLNRFDARRGMAHEANATLNDQPRLTSVIRYLSAYEKVFGLVPRELEQFRSIWKEILDAFGAGA